MVPVESQVDSGVDVLILHTRKLGDIAMPSRSIVADKIIAFAGKYLRSAYSSVLVDANQFHAYKFRAACDRRLTAQTHRCAIRGQNQAISAAVRKEFHAWVRLTDICLEPEGQLAQGPEKLTFVRHQSHPSFGRTCDCRENQAGISIVG